MTDISPIASGTPTERLATETRASISRSALADNLDTFLQLLTTQLRNQDPLQPMDTNQFVDQLTQFSELEQGVEQTDTLNEIAATLGAGDRQSDLGLLGRTVEAQTDVIALGPEGARFAYDINTTVKSAEMRIFDEGGNLVARFDVEPELGRVSAGWDGSTLDGTRAAPGLYQAQIVSRADDGSERLVADIFSGGTVREVRFENGATRLVLDQGMVIRADDVIRVAVPESA